MFWTLVVFNLGSPKAAPCLFAHKIVHLCQGTPVSFSNARNGESVYKDQSPQAEPGKRLRLVSKIQGASVDQDGSHLFIFPRSTVSSHWFEPPLPPSWLTG